MGTVVKHKSTVTVKNVSITSLMVKFALTEGVAQISLWRMAVLRNVMATVPTLAVRSGDTVALDLNIVIALNV